MSIYILLPEINTPRRKIQILESELKKKTESSNQSRAGHGLFNEVGSLFDGIDQNLLEVHLRFCTVIHQKV